MAHKFAIEDHPPRRCTKNIHEYMEPTLIYKQVLLSSATAAGATSRQFCWVPGMEGTRRTWMHTEAFALGLATTFTVDYDRSDAMNDAIELFMIQPEKECGAV